MAVKRTERTNKSVVKVNLAAGEYIDYSLTVSGARGVFAMADTKNRVVMKDTDWPAPQQTYHKRWPQETPQAPPENGEVYSLAMSFITALKYTYVVKRCQADGKLLQIIKDIDFESQIPQDTATVSLTVFIGGAGSSISGNPPKSASDGDLDESRVAKDQEPGSSIPSEIDVSKDGGAKSQDLDSSIPKTESQPDRMHFRPTFASFESDLVAFDQSAFEQPLEDALGVKRYAGHLAQLIAARETPLPLSIGLFADWGVGKSYFIRLMHQQIEEITQNPAHTFCPRVVQIHFNAWHYLDTSLWANLVCEIFDQLFGRLSERHDINTSTVEGLKKKLGEKSALVAEARDALNVAQLARAKAEERLVGVEEQRRAQEMTVASFIDDLTNVVDNDKLRKELESVSSAFGLERLKDSFTQLEESAVEVRTLAGRMKAIALALLTGPDRWRRFGLLSGALLLPVLLGWAVPLVLALKDSNLSDVVRTITQAATLILAMTTWITAQARRGSDLVGRLEVAYERVRTVRDEKRKQSDATNEQKKLEQCRKVEGDAQHALSEAEARVRSIEEQLSELTPGRRLFRFLEERAGTADYRKHLGLVSLVRRDFEQLSCLVRDSSEFKDGDQPIIDRIVLYIDDLDRCPGERVIQVLEAVHLLLAFPLFAVVVAVDPRWLRQSLLEHYPGLSENDTERGDGNSGKFQRQTANPQDYLEKIFQVPFHLQPLERIGFEELVGRLFPQGPSGSANETPGAPTIHNEQVESPTSSVATTPERLRLESWEIESLKKCSPFFRTPRAVKRFANTYCLIRVGVESKDWEKFLGSPAKPGLYRTPMLMLAVSAAFPNIAGTWLDGLFDGDLKTWIPTDKVILKLAGPNSSYSPKSVEWQELADGLREMKAETFSIPDRRRIKDWVPAVKRYTF